MFWTIEFNEIYRHQAYIIIISYAFLIDTGFKRLKSSNLFIECNVAFNRPCLYHMYTTQILSNISIKHVNH